MKGMALEERDGEEYTIQAAECYIKAAENNDAFSLYKVGGYFETGKFVAKDMDRARMLYQRAAELGCREARQRLAEM